MKKYEVEIQRTNISPRQFFTYCKKEMKNRTGVSLQTWCDSFEDWSSDKNEYVSECYHDDWKVPVKEICKTKAYEWHLFLGKAYNFIMEFQFCDENKGSGYLYAVEFER